MFEEYHTSLVSEMTKYYNTVSIFRSGHGIVLCMSHFSNKDRGFAYFYREKKTKYIPFRYKGVPVEEVW